MKFKTRKYIDDDDKYLSLNDLKQALRDDKTIEDLIIDFYEKENS